MEIGKTGRAFCALKSRFISIAIKKKKKKKTLNAELALRQRADLLEAKITMHSLRQDDTLQKLFTDSCNKRSRNLVPVSNVGKR